jgi:hypothetical protein
MADQASSGPNWIHGTENNPILDLAKETKTITMNWDGRQSVVDALGNYLSDEEAAANTELVWSIIEQAMKHSNAESATIPAAKSLYDYFQEAVQKLFTDVSAEEAKRKRETILQMSEMWGAFVGSPVQQQSLKFFWMEECIDGENLFVAGTYREVLKKIAAPALEAGIKFGYRVKKLVSNTGGHDPSITVELDGRESETFDEVVMTAPLGWLKKNLDAFEPALPSRLQEGIQAIGYGHLDKVGSLHLLIARNILNNDRSTSPSQQPFGTPHPPRPLLKTQLQNSPRQSHPPSPTFPPQPHPSTNSAPPTPQSTQTTTQASPPSSPLPTPTLQTPPTGTKKPSTSPPSPAQPPTPPSSSTPTAPPRNTSPPS